MVRKTEYSFEELEALGQQCEPFISLLMWMMNFCHTGKHANVSRILQENSSLFHKL